jgi:hypothetical protein
MRPENALPSAADSVGALLAVGRPGLGKHVIGHVVALDAERLSYDAGGGVAVIGIDGLFEQLVMISLTNLSLDPPRS